MNTEKLTALRAVSEELAKLADSISKNAKSPHAREAAITLKYTIRECVEAEMRVEELQRIAECLTPAGREAIGFLNGQLVYSQDGQMKPITLGQCLRHWAQMERSSVADEYWSEEARAKFLRLVVAKLRRAMQARK